MSFRYYLRVELRRLMLSPGTWLVAILTLCSPLAGYRFYMPTIGGTRSNLWIANPVLAGALGGTILFAMLTLYELDRIRKSNMGELTDSVVSPLSLNTAKLMALLLVAVFTALLTMVVYLPFTAFKMGHLFGASTYFASYFIVLLPALWLGVLFATLFYRFTYRVDLSVILLVASAAPCYRGFLEEDFILRWINPNVPVYSDGFSNAPVLRTVFYNRLFWLFILGGICLLSGLCTRKYGKGMLGSFLVNAKKLYRPLTAAICIGFAVFLYLGQPFVNHAPMEYGNHNAMSERVTVNAISTLAKPNVIVGTQHGTTTYLLTNSSNNSVECSLEIDCGYTVKGITANGQPLLFTDLNNDLYLSKLVTFQLPAERDIELVVTYGGYPQIWSNSASILTGNEISSRFVNLTVASFAPLVNAVWGRQMTNTADVVLPGSMTPLVMGGSVQLMSDNGDGTKTWHLDRGKHSMVYMYAADYAYETIIAGDTETNFYYARNNKQTMDKYNVTGALREVLDFCSEKYGLIRVSVDQKLTLLQLSATMFGGYASSGMSVFGETTFAEDTLNDPWRGASGQEVMAHEIVHQWWGGLGVGFEGEYDLAGDPEWTSEGFTVYTTYRIMKEKFGEQYARENYVAVWEQAVENMKRNFYHRNPQYMEILPERYASRITSSERQVKAYCIMPLKILKAAELVGGEEKMDEIMGDLYKQKAASNNPVLTYSEFLSACGLTKEALDIE